MQHIMTLRISLSNRWSYFNDLICQFLASILLTVTSVSIFIWQYSWNKNNKYNMQLFWSNSISSFKTFVFFKIDELLGALAMVELSWLLRMSTWTEHNRDTFMNLHNKSLNIIQNQLENMANIGACFYIWWLAFQYRFNVCLWQQKHLSSVIGSAYSVVPFGRF